MRPRIFNALFGLSPKKSVKSLGLCNRLPSPCVPVSQTLTITNFHLYQCHKIFIRPQKATKILPAERLSECIERLPPISDEYPTKRQASASTDFGHTTCFSIKAIKSFGGKMKKVNVGFAIMIFGVSYSYTRSVVLDNWACAGCCWTGFNSQFKVKRTSGR